MIFGACPINDTGSFTLMQTASDNTLMSDNSFQLYLSQKRSFHISNSSSE